MVPVNNIRKIQVLAVFFVICSLLTGLVSAGQANQYLTGIGGSCCDSCCNQTLPVSPFGGTCGERVIMISLGMSGASFSGTPTSGPAPLQVQFYANSGPEIATWSWDFGDGTYGSGMNPVHIYTTPGTYTVKLTVRQSQAGVNYQTPAYFTWGQENTWQKEAMIQVTGLSGTGNLVSSDTKGILIPASAIIQADGTVQPDLSILYSALTIRKIQTLDYQRGKLSQRTTVLTPWKTSAMNNGR